MEWTTQSNNFSHALVPVSHHIVNSVQITGKIIPRTYSNGTVEFGLRPIRVQW